ncbi:helix-turn-helix domain protein [Thermofilum pendens Hrk 5]|uniref:Helix-turn-helix domain protein n=2 Tax=Thermofilum pendens TaxID=2269 RepID=A1RWC0_THEPD|nr:helix-turn-helix domain protein [Thermofilum pendens Hrk 5]
MSYSTTSEMAHLKAPCEEISRRVLPAVRSILVRYLYEQEGLTQLQIAKLLGISQSSVSRYLNSQRGLSQRDILEIPSIDEKLRETVHGIVEGKLRGEEALCSICQYIRMMSREVSG